MNDSKDAARAAEGGRDAAPEENEGKDVPVGQDDERQDEMTADPAGTT